MQSAGYLNKEPTKFYTFVSKKFNQKHPENNDVKWIDVDKYEMTINPTKDNPVKDNAAIHQRQYPVEFNNYLPVFNFGLLMKLNKIKNYVLLNPDDYVIKIGSKYNQNDELKIFKINNKFEVEEQKEFDKSNIKFDKYTNLNIKYSLLPSSTFKKYAYEIEFFRRGEILGNLYTYYSNTYLKSFIEQFYIFDPIKLVRNTTNIANKMMFIGKFNTLFDIISDNTDNNNIIENLKPNSLRVDGIKTITQQLKAKKSTNDILLEMLQGIKGHIAIANTYLDSKEKFKYLVNTILQQMGLKIDDILIDQIINDYFSINNKLINDMILYQHAEASYELFNKASKLKGSSINSSNIGSLNKEIKKDINLYYSNLVIEMTILKYISRKINNWFLDLKLEFQLNLPAIIIGSYFLDRLETHYEPMLLNKSHQFDKLIGVNDQVYTNENLDTIYKSDLYKSTNFYVLKNKNEQEETYIKLIDDDVKSSNKLIMDKIAIRKPLLAQKIAEMYKNKPIKINLDDVNTLNNYISLVLNNKTGDQVVEQIRNISMEITNLEKDVQLKKNEKNKLLESVKSYKKLISNMSTFLEGYIYKMSSNNAFKIIAQSHFTHNKQIIPDCGETTFRNLFNFLIWNFLENNINITLLPKKTDSVIKKYYDKFSKIHDHNSPLSHEMWAMAVMDVKNIKYNRGKVELIPSINNIINLLITYLNIDIPLIKIEKSIEEYSSIFKQIFDLFNTNKESTSDEKNKFDFVLTKKTTPNNDALFYLDFKNYKLEFMFSSSHGDVSFKANKLEGINQITSNKDFISLNPNINFDSISFFTETDPDISTIGQVIFLYSYDQQAAVKVIEKHQYGYGSYENIIFNDGLLSLFETTYLSFFNKLTPQIFKMDDNILHILFRYYANSNDIKKIYNLYKLLNKTEEFKNSLFTENQIHGIPFDNLLDLGNFQTNESNTDNSDIEIKPNDFNDLINFIGLDNWVDRFASHTKERIEVIIRYIDGNLFRTAERSLFLIEKKIIDIDWLIVYCNNIINNVVPHIKEKSTDEDNEEDEKNNESIKNLKIVLDFFDYYMKHKSYRYSSMSVLRGQYNEAERNRENNLFAKKFKIQHGFDYVTTDDDSDYGSDDGEYNAYGGNITYYKLNL
jgi:hypothetical protein